MRAERLSWLVASLTIAGSSAACAALAGLEKFTQDDLTDGGGSPPEKDVTVPDTSGDDQVTTTDDGPAQDDVGDDGDATETGDAADAADGIGPGGHDAQTADASDGDGGPGLDAAVESGPGGNDASDACTTVVHTNGLPGGFYQSCAPIKTYGQDEAALACAASHLGTCAPQPIFCIQTVDFECATTAQNCTCWSYQTPNPGFVHVSTLAGGLCQCAGPGDPAWQ
ncbi:MAG TPA: hypothetical protein VH044_19475 [Polyangiaceae bacterium]|nr:hypothetical protein [Polyangiaceae bacterium]